jgi:hypothetical protein
MTPEAKILAHAKRCAKAHGLRFVRLSLRQGVEVGWPDVMILGPNRRVLFMETKAPGEPLRPIQAERKREIEFYGHDYCKPDSKAAVDKAVADFAMLCVRSDADA